MSIEKVAAIPYQISSRFTRSKPAENQIEIHSYVSVNGGIPKHTVEYLVYNSKGKVEKSESSRVDKMA